MDDRELLERLRAGAGAQEAFDAIFRSYYARLVAVAESLLRERPAAEDVAQDVMVEVWRRRDTLVLETSLRAYLFRAVRNRALNYIRHQRVAPNVDLEAAGDRSVAGADLHVVEQELNAALRHAVAGLPERCREVFELSRVHGCTYAEIAEALGISIKTVEAQMGKAIRVLRTRLAAWLPRARGLEPDEDE